MAKKEVFYFVELDSDGDLTGSVYKDEDEVKNNCCGGETVVKVKAVKKYEVVDESVKLVEIK